jgi:NADPH:quinone reductase-like Zn-dependent oxidoreductase
MKAFIVDRYGNKNPMRLGEVPEPELQDDDVLIQVHAAGVNLLGCKIKSGGFRLIPPYRMPLALGHDVAGVVTRVRSRVRQFRVGDYPARAYSKPGTTLISISGPPDSAFAEGVGAPWFVSIIVRMLSSGAKKKAARRGLKYSFLVYWDGAGSRARRHVSRPRAGPPEA